MTSKNQASPISWEEARRAVWRKNHQAFAAWEADGDFTSVCIMSKPHGEVISEWVNGLTLDSRELQAKAWLSAYGKMVEGGETAVIRTGYLRHSGPWKCARCPFEVPYDPDWGKMSQGIMAHVDAEHPESAPVAPSVGLAKGGVQILPVGTPDEVAAKLEAILGEVQENIHDQWDWMNAHFYVTCLRAMANDVSPTTPTAEVPAPVAEGSLPPKVDKHTVCTHFYSDDYHSNQIRLRVQGFTYGEFATLIDYLRAALASQPAPAESWGWSTSKAPLDINSHPLIRQSYEVSQAIELCEAGENQTAAVVKSGRLTQALFDFLNDENYVAWIRYKRNGDRVSVHVCNSDDEGAFRVYKFPAPHIVSGGEREAELTAFVQRVALLRNGRAFTDFRQAHDTTAYTIGATAWELAEQAEILLASLSKPEEEKEQGNG